MATSTNPLKPLFFQNPLQHWHFKDIIKASGLSRERVNFYLRGLLKEQFILRKKPKRKQPYYQSKTQNSSFRLEKRLYGLSLLQESGLFEHLSSSSEIKTAILFGSFARGDWGKSSDIDLFVYGQDEALDKGKFELKLHRELQIFSFKSAAEIKRKVSPALLSNIAKGFNIKGTLEPLKVSVHA
jgi:predicted nucleotidyltransferase